MELLILSLFCSGLILCIALDLSILYALIAGLILFLFYGKRKGFSIRQLAKMSFSGIKQVKNIMIAFALIGILTALWRASGTIPAIVSYAAKLIHPSIFLLMAFLLNCLVSLLTGTSFGTAATMGVICTTIASAMQIPAPLVGGAVLSGAFFGDRCSPVSTSALLVAELTQTNIFGNIRNMLRSAVVPFLASCMMYALTGIAVSHVGPLPDLYSMFQLEFHLHWSALLPAAAILLLAFFQVNVKISMAASILVALPVCVFLQHIPLNELPEIMLFGYVSKYPEISSMLNGGGILSMVNVSLIVCLSASYSGIFQETGLLEQAKRIIFSLSQRTTPFLAILLTSLVSAMIACNQSLATMLTHQLCHALEPDTEQFALSMEDTVIVVAPLIPWSIAAAVPLTSAGSPFSSIFFAFFLYLLPLWRLIVSLVRKRQRSSIHI